MKMLRKIALALGLLSAVVGVGAVAAPTGSLQLFTGPAGTNPINFPSALADLNQLIIYLNNLLGLSSANSAFAPIGPVVELYASTGVATTTTTAEQTLASYVLPANAFDQPGRKLRIKAGWLHAATSTNAFARCYFAGTVFSSGGVNTSAAPGEMEMIVALGATTDQFMYSHAIFGATGTTIVEQVNTFLTAPTTSPINIWCSGADPTVGDITLIDFNVEAIE